MTISKISLGMNISTISLDQTISGTRIKTKGKSADSGGTLGNSIQNAGKALNVVIWEPGQLMVLEYAMTQINLEDFSMNVTAGMRMVIEFQAVLMSSNAVLLTGSLFGLGSVA